FEGFPGEGTFKSIYAPGGAARVEALFEGSPPARCCTNGEVYWMTGTGGTEIKKGWSAAADVRLFAFGRHRDWREVYASAELVGEAKIGGRPCHELRLVPKSPEELGIETVPGEEPPVPDNWWLDRESKDLVRVAIYATVSGAGWQRLVLDDLEWKSVAGVRFPHRSRMTFGPSDRPIAIEFVVESVDVDAKYAENPFALGEQVFAALIRGHARDANRDPGFKIEPRKDLRTATVRVRCKPEQVRQQLATILPEVMGYLQRERLTLVGAPFARYHAFDPEVDLEAGIPVAETIRGNGRIQASSLPGGEVVSGTHIGPYGELPRTHEALAKWLASEGRTAAGAPWEIYWTDPGLQRDPSKWRTEIVQPVSEGPDGGARPLGAVAKGEGKEGAQRREDPKPGVTAAADADLERLDVLVGTWRVSGGPGAPEGEFSFEWLEGGHFLVQRVNLVQGRRVVKGIEIIGHERKFGAESRSPDLTSRIYDNMGNTWDYTWEIGVDTLTIWGGAKGSPVVYRARFSEDRNTLTGAWEWPGGGFQSTATRITRPEAGTKRAAALVR
ncbi:MAG: GyrI-like domain-containing protein, partial [Planctomycetota bacterium]